MQYKFVPYLWISITLTIILFFLIRFSSKRFTEKGVPYFLATLILSAIWVVSQALEIAAVDLSVKLFWANMMYIPSTMIPVAYFYLALRFVGLDKWSKKRWLLTCLLLIPLIYNLLLWTNGYHELIRQNIYLDTSGSFPVVGKTYGPLFWIYSVYNYLVTIVTLAILVKGLHIHNNQMERAQIISLFIGLLLPAFSVFIFISKALPLKVDPSPIMIGISAIIISWSILRYHLFDLVSFAHSIIINEMSTGMIILDNSGSVLEINPAAQSMLSVFLTQSSNNSIETVLNAYPRMIQAFRNQKNETTDIFTKTETSLNYCEVSLKQLTNSENVPVGWIYQIYDVTRRKLEEERIKELATHDALTGLINRTYFEKIFSSSLEASKISGTSLAVAYLDLDDFKQVNDTFGHGAGDILLRAAANRLKVVLKGLGIVSRYGGDEFAVMFPSIENRNALKEIACNISNQLESSIEYEGTQIPLRASIGFSIYPEDGNSLEVLIRKADEIMYANKRTKKALF
ncbi:MAG: diguanylate cyclase [Oscillospiraceae bacterium]|nr:diguanylate cyclase [Oscillospiraceae bacterium]